MLTDSEPKAEIERLTEAIDANSAALAETAVDGDGWIYRVDDGEIVGRIDETRTNWRAADESAIDWALGLRAEIEADLAALRLRENAVIANFAKKRAKLENKLGWWKWRFWSDVVAFARRALDGGKSRTLQLENGAVRFRATAGTNKIVDQDAAVAYVEAHEPFRVKVARSVTVNDILNVAAARGGDPAELAGFLYSTGPGESVVVDTGIGKA